VKSAWPASGSSRPMEQDGISLGYTHGMAKVLISIPEDVLAQVDKEAAVRGVSRSQFMREAALREMGWPDPERLGVALQRGRAALQGAGQFESATLIEIDRHGRDERDQRRR
jgi:hypothetical protein